MLTIEKHLLTEVKVRGLAAHLSFLLSFSVLLSA